MSAREVIANVQDLHQDPANQNALFQVASQFNLLEMMAPDVTPERGIGIYERDPTQGPACAIAAGAGTIYRNYFADVNGRSGQTSDNQFDCLAPIGAILGNTDQRLWQMVNGYALPTDTGLQQINQRLQDIDEAERDQLRQALQIGLQWKTQVTKDDASHTVSQAFCSALPIAYTRHSLELWAPFAMLVLEATYEATLCAARINADQTGNRTLFLTLVGGGAFGNEMEWITRAIQRALSLHVDSGLDVCFVSRSNGNPHVAQIVSKFAA